MDDSQSEFSLSLSEQHHTATATSNMNNNTQENNNDNNLDSSSNSNYEDIKGKWYEPTLNLNPPPTVGFVMGLEKNGNPLSLPRKYDETDKIIDMFVDCLHVSENDNSVPRNQDKKQPSFSQMYFLGQNNYRRQHAFSQNNNNNDHGNVQDTQTQASIDFTTPPPQKKKKTNSSKKQAVLSQNKDGTIKATTPATTQESWAKYEKAHKFYSNNNDLPMTDALQESSKKKKDKKKKKKSKSKKSKKVTNNNESSILSPLTQTPKSTPINTQKSKATHPTVSRKSPSASVVPPKKVQVTRESFEGIQDIGLSHISSTVELGIFMNECNKAEYIAFTMIYFDEYLSTPFVPQTKKYCSKRTGPCVHWNCICDNQVRGMQARQPVFGAMFVTRVRNDNVSNAASKQTPTQTPTQTQISETSIETLNTRPNCFLLPLGRVNDKNNEPEPIPPGFGRFSQWPLIPFDSDLPLKTRWETLRNILGEFHIKCVTYNAVVSLLPYHFHLQYDVRSPQLIIPEIWDTRVMQWMLRSNSTDEELEFQHSLGLGEYSHLRMVNEDNCEGLNSLLKSLKKTKQNLELLYQIFPVMSSKFKQQELDDSFFLTEAPLQSLLAAMEQYGVPYSPSIEDERKLETSVTELTRKMRRCTKNASFNPSSSQQVSHYLFDKLKMPPPSDVTKGKSGFISVNSDVLKNLKESLKRKESSQESNYDEYIDILDTILELREVTKLLNTFVKPFPMHARAPFQPRSKRSKKNQHSSVARIHPMWQQTAVKTGRLSCRKPNMQQVSGSTDIINFRSYFRPSSPKSMCFMACDYSQNEVRILAHMSNDTNLISMFNDENDEVDIYKEMAAGIHGKPASEITKRERAISKQVTLAIMYGMGHSQVAKNLNVDINSAKKFINSFYGRFPGVKKWMDEVKQFARTNGYVNTILKRRRYLDHITNHNDSAKKAEAERQAVNTVIQGSAADLIKVAMIKMAARIQDWNKEYGGAISDQNSEIRPPPRILLQIHDELLFEVYDHPDEINRLKETINRCCTTECRKDLSLNVPLTLTCKIGSDWGNMKDMDKQEISNS